MTRSSIARITAGGLCAAVVLSAGQAAVAGPARTVAPPQRPAAGSLETMDARLAAVVSAFERGGAREAAREAGRQRVRLTTRGAVVLVTARTAAGAGRTAVAAAGGRVDRQSGRVLEGRVPLGRLRALARDARIELVRAPALHLPDVTSEGVSATRADLWHGAGYGGVGRVAVIDLGFVGFSALLGSELPISVTTWNGCAGGLESFTNHGTGVAEIVHDMAPNGQLMLICVDSNLDLQPAVAAAAAWGATVINHSVGWFDVSRGDGTGGPDTPDAAALSARQQGILWVNSAGNYRERHWSGSWADGNASDLLDWTPSQDFNQVSISPGQTGCVTLRWDAWPLTNEDFDLYLLDSSLDFVPGAWSFRDQAGLTLEPWEEFCWQNTTGGSLFYLIVHRFSASTSPRFDLFVLGGFSPPQVRVQAGSLAEPASSPAVLAVGASCRSNGVAQPYSSLGPTIDGRVKPELMGPDATSGVTYGASSSCSTGFTGTSAASPHVAGLAALLKHRFPAMTPARMTAYLRAVTRADDPAGLNAGLHPVVTGGPIVAQRDVGVWSMNADGSNPTQVSAGGADSRNPSFAPNGASIVYAEIGGASREIFQADPDGSMLANLTNTPAFNLDEGYPTWTPDGAKILFESYQGGGGGDHEIESMNADGTGRAALTANTIDDWDPQVAGVGGKVAFNANTEIAPGFFRLGDVYVMNGDGSGRTNLTGELGHFNYGPDFSADGTKIAFSAGNTTVTTMNPDGTGKTALGPGTNPAWTGDGKIVFTGAGGSLYRMEANGSGVTRLTYASGAGFSAPDVGPATAPPEAVVWPTLSGTRQEGQYLAAAPAAWVGGGTLAVAFQWYRCDAIGQGCAAIAGANDVFYRLTAADSGMALRYSETASGPGGAATVYLGVPVSLSPPLVIGSPRAGAPLRVGRGRWDGSPSQYSYRWQRSRGGGEKDGPWEDVGGATGPTFTPTSTHMGARIRVIVTGSNLFGSGTSAPSAASGIVGGQPVPESAVRIDTSLTPFRVVPATWRAYPAPAITRQWFRCTNPFSCLPIVGETGGSYTPTGLDVGTTLRVDESATNVWGTGLSISAQTAPIALVNTAPPTVSGTAQVGQLLTASTGVWAPPGGLTYAYRWQRAFEGNRWLDLAGATASTYTVQAGDRRASLRVVVTATAAGGAASAASAPTGPVVASLVRNG